MKSNSDLEKAKKVMLSMLREFDRICKKYDLRYWIDYGTLLGAIRHKGFIPWDDDIDVSMPREDFNHFLKIVEKELPQQMFFQTKHTDPEFRSNIARIRDLKSIFKNGFYEGKINGIFIDIFPVDTISSRHVKLANILKIYFSIDPFKKWYGSFKHRLIHYFLSPLLIFFPILKFLKNNYLLNAEGDTYIIDLELYEIAQYKKIYFDKLIDLEFEGFYFKAPEKYHEVLTEIYGDYMKLPPEKDRVPHHHYEIEFLENLVLEK